MKKILALMAAAIMLVFTAGAAQAAGTYNITYRGQGTTAGVLDTEVCGSENGAEADGAYILWVYTATNSSTATITGPWGTAPMTKTANGAFKYVSEWYALDSLTGNVSATSNFDGRARNPQLVISHGCPGEQPPCDPTDPSGECYVCDPTDPSADCYCDPYDTSSECYVGS